MNEPNTYSAIALVSGKGGVGKTTITANIAWLIAQAPANVVIIDLDFQNLGCTGLFASHYNLEDSNALTLLRTNGELKNCNIALTNITQNLHFLPAALIVQTEERHDTAYKVPEDIYDRLGRLLKYLYKQFSVDCFVLDCHGGIDATSFAAAGICDHTLIITEADTVTFAGTLGLVDGCYDQYKSSRRKPTIDYIVNRIPPKYKWRDLNNLYQTFLDEHLGRFTQSKAILSYIPAEGYLADSFGDYPFQVQLAPKSIFTRKLELILFSLFDDSNPKLIQAKAKKRNQKKRYAKKIARRTISHEARNTRSIFAAYIVVSLYFYFVYPLYFFDDEAPKTILEGRNLFISLPLIAVILLGSFRNFFYFREKFKFHKALFRLSPKEKTIWRRLNLWKLRILYYGAAVGPLFLTVAVIATFGLTFSVGIWLVSPAIVIGLIAGWLAGKIIKGKGFGLVGNLIVGVIGALLGSFLFGLLGTDGLIGSLVSGLVGAIISLWIVGVVKKT